MHIFLRFLRFLNQSLIADKVPIGKIWFWTITTREQPPSVYNRGYAASREQAMADFKARWSASIN